MYVNINILSNFKICMPELPYFPPPRFCISPAGRVLTCTHVCSNSSTHSRRGTLSCSGQPLSNVRNETKDLLDVYNVYLHCNDLWSIYILSEHSKFYTVHDLICYSLSSP